MLKVVAYTGKPPDTIFVNVVIPNESRLTAFTAVVAAKVAFGHRQDVGVFDGEAGFWVTKFGSEKVKVYKND